MGAFDDYFASTTAKPAADEAPSELSKSLRAGAYGARSQIQSLAGVAGEAMGFDNFAKNRNADAAELQAQAQANAPRIGSYKQVLDSPDFSTGLRNAGDYVTGLVGSSLPIMGAGLVGGMVGGIGGGAAAAGRAMLGAAAATAPFEMGDVAQKQLADPQAMKASAGSRLRDVFLGGGASAAVQSVVPGLVANKILGQGAKQAATQTLRQTIGNNLASIPMEGVTEAGGEAVKQFSTNQSKPLDVEALKESFVGGAAAGGAFAGVGTVADVAHGNAAAVGNAARSATSFVGDRASKLLNKAQTTAETVQTEAPKKFNTISEDIGALMTRGREFADASIDKIMTGQPLVDAQAFATEAGQKLSDDARVQKATEWTSKMANDAGLTPERRQQAIDMAQTAGTEAGQVAAAVAKKTYDSGMTAAVKISNLYDSLADKVNKEIDLFRAGKAAQEEANGIKQSADYSGTNRAIADQLGPLLNKTPGLADRPEAVAQLVDSMRLAAVRMRSKALSPETETMLSAVFGADAPEALKQSFNASGNTNQAEIEQFYMQYNKYAAKHKRSMAMEKSVIDSLTPESRDFLKPSERSEFVQTLMRHANGTGVDPNMGPQQRLAENQAFRNLLDGLFDTKADSVLSSLEAEAGLRFESDKAQSDESVDVQDAPDGNNDMSDFDDLDGVDFTERSTTNETDEAPADAKNVKDYVSVRKFGHNTAGRMAEDGDAVMAPDVFARKARDEGLTGKNDGAQLLLDAQEKYPDSKYNVYFKRDGKNSTTGHVVVETLNNPDDFTDRDLNAMRLAENYNNSPDKITIKGRNFDSKRIAKAMQDSVPFRYDGQPSNERLSELFSAGAARLMVQFGNFDIPDTVTIGQINGENFTFGDAKALKRNAQAEDRMSARGKKELAALRADYKNAVKKNDETGQDEILNDVQNLLAREKNKELGVDIDVPRDSARAKAAAKLSKDHARHIVNAAKYDIPAKNVKTDMGDFPFEENDSRFDDEGNLTRAGAVDLLEDRRAVSKDENVRRVMVGDNTALNANGNSDTRSTKALTKEEVLAESKKDKRNTRPNEDLVARSNMDGSPNSQSSIDSTKLNMKPAIALMRRMEDSEKPIAIELAKRLETLLDNKQALSDKDRVKLSRLGTGMTASEVAEVINPINDKYQATVATGPVTAPARSVKERLNELRLNYSSLSENDKQILAQITPNMPASEIAKVFALIDRPTNERSARLVEPKVITRPAKRDPSAARDGPARDARQAELDETFGEPSSVRSASARNGVEPLGQDLENAIGRLAEKTRSTSDPKPVAADTKNLMQKAIDKRQEYLNNPPDNYSTEVAKGHLDWATSQKERVDAEYEKIKTGDDFERQDQLSDLRGSLKRLIAKGKSVLEGDASLEDIGGETPSPKSLAAKKAALLKAASSSDPALLDELSTTDDARALQRTVAELPPGAAADAANARMAELVQDPNVAYDLTRSGNSKTDVAAMRTAIQDYITKVLGNSVKLQFKDMSHAGEFERMRLHDIIRLSTTALDPMSTAHHEALHGFFAQLRKANATDVMGVLEKAANSENVIRQLNELYKNNGPVLAQLSNSEERVAYMYQHWAAGNLTIGLQPRTIMARVAEFIRGVLGVWSNDQRALAILHHFNSGEYAASGRDIGATQQKYIQGGRNQALDAAKSFTAPLARLADAVVSTGSGRLRDTGIPSILRIADIIKREATDIKGGDQGFIAAARIESTKRNSALAESLKKYSQDELHEAMEGLQRGRGYNGANATRIREAQAIIKATLADTRGYMLAAGVDIGNLGPDYFPRVWDSHFISKNQQAFKDMMEPYIRRGEHRGSADDLMRDLMARDGSEFGVDRKKLDFDKITARPPGMQFKKTRLLSYITPEDAAMFVNKDLLGTLTTYMNQATRKAEWSRRLGNGKLELLFEAAKKEGATTEQLKMTDTYLRGIDGTLGDSINPHARRIMGNMIVYQNIRLLPFAIFSSIIDPMGVMIRGGSMVDAFATFKRGIMEIPKGLGKQSADDRATQLAELVGVIDSAVLANTLGDVYTQGMVGGFAKKANAMFFKYNLMEGLNRSFRIGASEAAIKFIARNADGTDSKHSQRWINELGLEAGDIIPTADGRIALTTSEGLSIGQERRVHAAINQWVDGAVLRPDAADKPIWFNDPRYALISHLKQFVYSFQKTILERVVHEYKNGNHTPAMALASYVPMMMAADFIKGMIQGGGEQPEWKKGWDMVDYTTYAVQRAGLFGVGQFGLDMVKDVREGGIGVGALIGPTAEQFTDVVQLLGGHKQFGPMVLNAMPANALYKNAFNNDAPDSPGITK